MMGLHHDEREAIFMSALVNQEIFTTPFFKSTEQFIELLRFCQPTPLFANDVDRKSLKLVLLKFRKNRLNGTLRAIGFEFQAAYIRQYCTTPSAWSAVRPREQIRSNDPKPGGRNRFPTAL